MEKKQDIINRIQYPTIKFFTNRENGIVTIVTVMTGTITFKKYCFIGK